MYNSLLGFHSWLSCRTCCLWKYFEFSYTCIIVSGDWRHRFLCKEIGGRNWLHFSCFACCYLKYGSLWSSNECSKRMGLVQSYWRAFVYGTGGILHSFFVSSGRCVWTWLRFLQGNVMCLSQIPCCNVSWLQILFSGSFGHLLGWIKPEIFLNQSGVFWLLFACLFVVCVCFVRNMVVFSLGVKKAP